MIVPMKKVTILCLAAHRDATLNALRGLGVMHLAPFQPPAGGDLESARRAHEDARQALSLLESLAGKASPAPVGLPPATAEELLQQTVRLAVRKHERAERRQHLSELIRHQEPYGDFEPGAIRELAARGISIRLFQADSKTELELPEGALRIELSRDKSATYIAVVNGADWSSAYAIERSIPERSLGALRQERADLEAEEAREDAELEAMVPYRNVMAGAVAAAADRLHWTEAREGMAHEGPLLFLRGFMPASDLPRLQAEAKRQGWGWQAEEPGDKDDPPTLIASSRMFRPIKVLFDMLGILPGYREADVSAVFLLFFSLFFAMLIGDAGYGLVLLGLTVLIHKKWKRAPRQLAPLLAILSSATVIWGILTGSYLGLARIPAPLNRLRIDALSDPVFVQSLCFLIGSLHMTIAHGWNITRLRHSITALAHVGWIGSCWVMFAMANYLVLGVPLPPGIRPLFILSAALILLFTVDPRSIKKEFASMLLLPLNIISHFGDVVSYLRLYLVGSASVVLIQAFNGIAFGDGPVPFWRGLVGVAIIFAVHVLNLILGSLAVLVHGVRLNALEFSTHMGIQWLGRKYTPFRREAAETEAIRLPERN